MAIWLWLVGATPGIIHAQTQTMLFDFGGADNQTARPPIFWNNVTATTGSQFFDQIPLVDTEGNDLDLQILIDQLFDGSADTAGSSTHPSYPSSASSDSLIRNQGSASFVLMGTEGSSDTYGLTFYASDATATDNRETAYKAKGNREATVTLNPSGNVQQTARIDAMGLDTYGEIIVTLTTGSNHSSANSKIYLGILAIESSAGWTALIDFGADENTTTVVADGQTTVWNNFTGTIGQTDDGIFEGVVSSEGQSSDLFIEMLARFNGVNTSGTTESELFPANATRDSLFGNIEEWSGMTDVLPSFLIGGLKPSSAYDITFYASRLASDNRETRYTLQGKQTHEVSLNVAGNLSETITASGVMPDASGFIQIDLSPGPANDNANHFIYLGVLKIQSLEDEQTYLFDFGGGDTTEMDVALDPESWNNVTESVGLTEGAVMKGLISHDYNRTQVDLEIISRFNGVNRAGTQESTLYPSTATADSLFGNTETFSGLENVFPSFKLRGLDQANAYDFTFYGSRSASDNRQTRYTVTGTRSAHGDLNAASNLDDTVSVLGIRPDDQGEILIEISPGPDNNNGNHFTYLGMMRMDWQPSFKPTILIDAGGTSFVTNMDAQGQVWNALPGSIAQSDEGLLPNLLSVNGAATGFGIQMLARFNGVNEAGTTEASPYPVTATQDSLYGNTELWGGLENIFPSFKLTGLDPATAYNLTFYASRVATDNRETQYTVVGNNQSVVALNVAGNVQETVVASQIMPSEDGTITISIEPGANNDNSYHFTYLGVLQLDWEGGQPTIEPVRLQSAKVNNGILTFEIQGQAGQAIQVESTTDFQNWKSEQNLTLDADSVTVEMPLDGQLRFYRTR